MRIFQSAEAAREFVLATRIPGPTFELAIAEGFTFAGSPDDTGAGMALVVDAILAHGYQPDGFDQGAGFRLYRYTPFD